MPRDSSGQNVGLEYVTSGTYQCEHSPPTALSVVADTEVELGLLATNIVCTEDALISWIRYRWAVWSIDEPLVFEWFLIKCQSTDAIQDLSDNLVIEGLQRDSKIFARGVQVEPVGGRDATAPVLHTHQFYNVKLKRGEELRMVIMPYSSCTASHAFAVQLLEWRQVGA